MLWVISNDAKTIREYIERGYLPFPSEEELRKYLKEGKIPRVIASYHPPEWAKGLFVLVEPDRNIFTSQEKRFLKKFPEKEKEILEKKYKLRIYRSSVSLKDLKGLDKIVELANSLRKFGLQSIFSPKSLMLVGLPGTGKSYSLKAIAGELGYYIAEIAIAELLENPSPISTLEAILRFLEEKQLPVILWVDEVEKIFYNDKGKSGELMNKLLTVLQEWNETSYFVKGFWWFTANNLKILKEKFPEFLRSERQDYLWFVDYPKVKDAREIAKLYFEKFFFAPPSKIGIDEKIAKTVQKRAKEEEEQYLSTFEEFLIAKASPYKAQGEIDADRITLTPAEIKTFTKMLAKRNFYEGKFQYSFDVLDGIYAYINPVIDIARDTISYMRSQRHIFKPLN